MSVLQQIAESDQPVVILDKEGEYKQLAAVMGVECVADESEVSDGRIKVLKG